MVSEKAAGEAALGLNEEKVAFGEVLDVELGDSKQSQENGRGKREIKGELEESEAFAAYGVMPTVIQILQQAGTVAKGPGGDVGESIIVDGEGQTASPRSRSEVANDASHVEANPRKSNPDDLVTGDKPDARQRVPAETAESERSRVEAARAEILKRLKRLESSEQKMPSPASGVDRALAQIARNTVEPAKIASGMVAAQRPVMLLASPRQEENAPQGEQKLSVRLERLEPAAVERPVRATNLNRETVPNKEGRFAEISAVAAAGELTNFEPVSEGQDVQTPRPVAAIELTEAIRTHVQLLKSSAQDRLDVVLRPDAHTELHLRVETVNGKIQVQARCERGDFALLEANWSTVQTMLASQGIRVEPLQTAGGTLSQQFSQHGQDPQPSFEEHSSRRQEREQFFSEQETPNRKSVRQPAASGGVVRGWQSWA